MKSQEVDVLEKFEAEVYEVWLTWQVERVLVKTATLAIKRRDNLLSNSRWGAESMAESTSVDNLKCVSLQFASKRCSVTLDWFAPNKEEGTKIYFISKEVIFDKIVGKLHSITKQLQMSWNWSISPRPENWLPIVLDNSSSKFIKLPNCLRIKELLIISIIIS